MICSNSCVDSSDDTGLYELFPFTFWTIEIHRHHLNQDNKSQQFENWLA